MNRPSLHELQCFVAVAEELSFSRGARRLHLSQPPLTRQIQALEARLGCALLLRNTRSVSVTAAGQLFLEDAREILTHLDAATDGARRAAIGETSRLRLGFVGALADDSFVRMLLEFRRDHPDWQIHLADLAPATQLEALASGQIDAAFVGAPPKNLARELQSVVWKREPLSVAIPSDHALAGAGSLALKDLRAEGWVMVSQEAAPAFRQLFADLCGKAGFSPRIVQQSERVTAVLTMVAANQGVSLVPASVEKLMQGAVVFRPVKGARPPQLAHACVVRRSGRQEVITDLLKILGQKSRGK